MARVAGAAGRRVPPAVGQEVERAWRDWIARDVGERLPGNEAFSLGVIDGRVERWLLRQNESRCLCRRWWHGGARCGMRAAISSVGAARRLAWLT